MLRLVTHLISSFLLCSSLAIACSPSQPGGEETDGLPTSNATDSDASTSDGLDSDASSTSSSDAGDIPTTSEPPPATGLGCGEPAVECEQLRREWCPEVGDMAALLLPLSGQAEVAELCAKGSPACELCGFLADACQGELGDGAPECAEAEATCLCRAKLHGVSDE